MTGRVWEGTDLGIPVLPMTRRVWEGTDLPMPGIREIQASVAQIHLGHRGRTGPDLSN